MIRRPPRSTLRPSSAASDVYKRQSLIRVHANGNIDIKLYKMINVTTVSTGTTHKHWSCNSLLWIVVSHSFLFLFFFFLCFQLTTTVSVDYCCCGHTFVSLPFLNCVLWSVFISLCYIFDPKSYYAKSMNSQVAARVLSLEVKLQWVGFPSCCHMSTPRVDV